MARINLPLLLAFPLLAFAPDPAHARDDDPAPGTAEAEESPSAATALDAITVTATRNPEPIADVPGTVSVIDSRQLEQQNANNPAEAVRYEPGVSIGNQPGRGGFTNYVIRGVGGNRVLLMIDDVPVPDFPITNLGAGTYTRDFVDLDSLKQIEIVRGPASALYGSDALGGVVAYVTKDPSDYLDLVGKDWYAGGKFGYDGSDSSYSGTSTFAFRLGDLETLLLYTRRQGHESDPAGDAKPNPQDYTTNSVLTKIVLHASDVDTLTLTGEFFQNSLDTDLLTDLTSPAVLSSDGDDTTRRGLVSLDWAHDEALPFADRTDLKIYWTGLNQKQLTDQVRSSSPPTPTTLRESNFRFVQDIYGAQLKLDTERTIFDLPNSFTYGVDASYTSTSHPRQRTQTDIASGDSTHTISGETFPNKNFPDTGTTKIGVYVQDHIAIGALTLLPGLRVDYYHLQPFSDDDFERSSFGDLKAEPLTEWPVSPKFGATYKLNDELTAFAQYAYGFRAPPYDNANFGFQNPVFGYEILPNPDLKPETSNGFEIGLRGRFDDGSSFSVAGFYNLYKDFIDTKLVGTSPGGLMEFQYVNLSNVTIYGAEARGDWHVLPGLSLRGSIAYAHGEDTDTNAPVDSVDPLKLIGGLRYQHPVDGWGAEAVVTHAWKHTRVSDPSLFQAPSYTTLDLMAFYELNPNFSINAGLFNVTNAKYWNSQDVTGVAADSSNLGLYAQPGRSFAINATLRW